MVDKGSASADGPRGAAVDNGPSDDMAWNITATLLAGPITWGLIGAGADHVLDTGRLFLAIGVVVGFITSFYIVYVRHGRD